MGPSKWRVYSAQLTTRSASKKQALLDAGADHVIVTGDEHLVERVKSATSGKGADLIFDPIAGDTLPTLAEGVAWGGQIILYGAVNGANVPYPLFTGFLRNFTLRTYMVYNFCGHAALGLPRTRKLSRAPSSSSTKTWPPASSSRPLPDPSL